MNHQTATEFVRKPMAPKAVAALILAIAACESGLFYGIPGIILGGIAGNLSRQARSLFEADPERYRGEKIIRAAEKWSRIGLIQGIVITSVWAVIISVYIVVLLALAVNSSC